ncbi:MAG: DNA-directed RNA polymerase subunit omega [Candidatus Omnitrophica bacterium]|nr:DNA-directed RNA polymerase subunit omega [Candidatus Omnitrophota bacterium]
MADHNVPVENLFRKTGSIYKLVVLASKRALELNAGSPKLTEAESDDVALLALDEIAEEKISYKKGPEEK